MVCRYADGMRLRLLSALGTVALLALVGCTSPPSASEPKPSSTPPVASVSPPAAEIVPPETAFDLSCDDVGAQLSAVLGDVGPVAPVLSTVSTMNWIPGPAQHMFARAGGLACSTGDETRSWEVTVVPHAQAVVDGAAERGGYWGETASCSEGGHCSFTIFVDDVLVSAAVTDPSKQDDTAALAIDAALRQVAARAAETQREVTAAPSKIVNVGCERMLTAAELGELLSSDVWLIQDFGGWGIPAEIYEIVNGSDICYYTSGPDEYEAQGYLMITSLPAGAWAFEQQEGTSVEVEKADAAITGTDAMGRPVLDLRVGTDWIRLAGYDPAIDLAPIAETVARNIAVGRPAPQ